MSQLVASDDRLQRALELAYRHLNRRERTVNEVREYLQRRGLEDGPINSAIETLCNQGYLDDARFARVFAEDKRELEQWGSDRIRRQLAARGVDRELIDATLGEDARADQLTRALAILRRRFPSISGAGREREHALGVLLRKGYDSELALDALRAYLAGDRDA